MGWARWTFLQRWLLLPWPTPRGVQVLPWPPGRPNRCVLALQRPGHGGLREGSRFLFWRGVVLYMWFLDVFGCFWLLLVVVDSSLLHCNNGTTCSTFVVQCFWWCFPKQKDKRRTGRLVKIPCEKKWQDISGLSMMAHQQWAKFSHAFWLIFCTFFWRSSLAMLNALFQLQAGSCPKLQWWVMGDVPLCLICKRHQPEIWNSFKLATLQAAKPAAKGSAVKITAWGRKSCLEEYVKSRVEHPRIKLPHSPKISKSIPAIGPILFDFVPTAQSSKIPWLSWLLSSSHKWICRDNHSLLLTGKKL